MNLQSELARFNPESPIGEALTPPTSWYMSGEFFDLEGATVFRRHPLMLARDDQLETLGSWASREVGEESWLATRDMKGKLHGLSNSCRHHGSRLCEGEGAGKEIVCPYHGWAYRLDGGLSAATGAGAIQGLGGSGCDLPTFPVAEWGRLLFLHPSGGLPLDPGLAALDSILQDSGWKDAKWVARRRYPMDCDWKVFVENYLDGGYHVSRVHPGLADGLELAAYETTWEEKWVLQICPETSPALGSPGEVRYLWIHPNLMINFYWPWVDVNFVIPTGPGRCEVVFDWWVDGSRFGNTRFVEESLAASDRVQAEDASICSRVQKGMRSASYEQGRYSPTREGGMRHFHRLLMEDFRSQAFA
jgi:choline monooxygenase